MIYDIDSFPGVKSFTRSMITYTGADTLSPKKGYNVDNFTYSDKGKIFERNKYENVRYADDTWDSVLYAKDGSWQTHLWYANFMGTEQVRSETYVYNEEKKPVKKHVELSVDGWVESESFLYDAKGVLTKACDTSTIDTTVVYYAYDKKGRCVSVRTIARTFLNIDSTVYSNDGALLKNIKLLTQHVFFDGKFRGDRFNYDSTIYTRKDGLVIQKDRYATGYGHRISTYEYDAQQRMIHSGTVSDAQASS
ncbi:MAG TPA: hypothetical protein VL651_03020, partial [Bacteroidia bacterium]|nr:hypothetical protein [Bacteroidia bacterium]